jgi:hypothetical protein
MTRALGRVANCEGVSEREPWEEAILALTKKGRRGLPDVVFFSEIAWLDLEQLCREVGGWHPVQHGERGSAEAGVGLAARVPLRPLQLRVGSQAAPEEGRRGVRMRPIVGARAPEWGGPALWAVHAPSNDTPQAQREYLRRARSCPGTLGGDWNRDVRWMQETSARKYRGHRVLGVLGPGRIVGERVTTVDIDSDHLAVDVPLYL